MPRSAWLFIPPRFSHDDLDGGSEGGSGSAKESRALADPLGVPASLKGQLVFRVPPVPSLELIRRLAWKADGMQVDGLPPGPPRC